METSLGIWALVNIANCFNTAGYKSELTGNLELVYSALGA